MLHPRYLMKRGRLAAIFAFLAAGAGVAQDPKFFRVLTTFSGQQRITTAWLAAFAVASLGAGASLLQSVLDSRYATPRQSWAAALLFIAIFTASWLVGFSIRLMVLEPSTSKVTRDDLLIAIILLCLGSALVAGTYNVAFTQKTDYTRLRAELNKLFDVIDDQVKTQKKDGYLGGEHADAMSQACAAAHAAASDVAKNDVPVYGELITSTYVKPLSVLLKAATSDGVDEVPESFIRACGLLDHGAEPDVANALQRLRNAMPCRSRKRADFS